jgi:type IV pilus assembly protein PilQ
MMHRKSKILWKLAAVLVAASMLGCTTPQPKSQPLPKQDWQKKAEESQGFSPSARDRSLDLKPKKIETYDGGQVYRKPTPPLPKRKITMKMHLADVTVLLRALARAVDLNIMINESVQGRISINVKDTPWDQVFIGILNSQGLAYEWEGNIVRIVTIEDRDRAFKNLEAEEQILSKQQALKMQAPLVTKIIPVDFACAEKLKENVEKILTSKKPGEPVGSVMVHGHTNSLIVQATPSDLQQIIPMIAELDRPTPQILIEAFIVETTNRTARELGVTWGGVYAHNGGTHFGIAPAPVTQITGASPTGGDIVTPIAGSGINFPANLDNAAQAGTGMALGFITQGADGILAMELSALEEEGKLNILSSPSITTLDNTKALIESGDEVPIPVITENTSNVIYKEALLRLEVTPHVIQGDVLKLDIVTTKNEVDFSRRVLTYPTIVAKKATTNVILFDGQTTVIGGLKKDTDQNNEAGVPWLRQLPLIGYLFKNESRSNQMQDLMIFITPRILKARPGSMPEARVAPPDGPAKQ